MHSTEKVKQRQPRTKGKLVRFENHLVPIKRMVLILEFEPKILDGENKQKDSQKNGKK
jgi:hypothetical protein